MRTKLLTEIERYRELMGVRLLNEATLPSSFFSSLAEMFGKTEDELFETLAKNEDDILDASEKMLRREFDDIASATGKSMEDFLDLLKKGQVGDDILDKLAIKLLQSSDPKIVQSTVKSFIKENPSLSKVYDYLNNPKKIEDVYKTGDDELIKKLEDLGPMIDNLPIGNETKQFMKQSFDNAAGIAKQEAKRVADEAAESLRKLQEELQAQADQELFDLQVEQAKLMKATTAKKQVALLEGAGKLPTKEAENLNKFLDELIASNPDATTEEIVLRGQQKLKKMLKDIEKELADADKLSKERKQKLLNIGNSILKALDLSRRMGKNAKSRTSGIAAIINLVFYTALIVGGTFAYKFAFGTDIDPGELDLIKEGIKNFIGDCITKEQIVVDFLGGKFPSKSDVFNPSEYFGEAVVKIPINKEMKTIVYDPKDASWKLYQTSNVVKCNLLDGIGVSDGTPPPPPPAEAALTDAEILALWKTKYPDGVKKEDGKYYINAAGTVDYEFDPSTKTFN